VDKEGFYEKNIPTGTPSWVKTFKPHSEKKVGRVQKDERIQFLRLFQHPTTTVNAATTSRAR